MLELDVSQVRQAPSSDVEADAANVGGYLNANTSADGARPVLLIVRDLIGNLLRTGAGNALVGQAYRA